MALAVKDMAEIEIQKFGSLEQQKVVFDEMEEWLWTSPRGQLTPEQVDHHTASLCERATVEKDKVVPYIEDVCVDALLQTKMSKATFRDNLRRAILTTEMTTLFHEISIPVEKGGTRVLETYMLCSKKSPDGTYSFLIAHFADISKLAGTFRWLAENHNERKVKVWLNYKLYLKVVETCPDLQDRKPNFRVQDVKHDSAEMTATSVTGIGQWTVRGIHSTLGTIIEDELTRGEELGFHYTDEAGAEGIRKVSLQVSKVGWHGGGFFFSTSSPVVDYAEDNSSLYKDVFPEFKSRQLRRNYGNDQSRGDHKADYVVLIKIPKKVIADVGPDREGAIFVSKTVYPDHFPKEKVLHVWKLTSDA